MNTDAIVWDVEVGERAVDALGRLIVLFRRGYSVDGFLDPMEASRKGQIARACKRSFVPTFEDYAHPERRLFTSLDPGLEVTKAELEEVLQVYVPAVVEANVHLLTGWLAREANGRTDWPGAQRLLDLAVDNWRHLPEFFATELVATAAQVNREAAFDLLQEVIESPGAAPLTKSMADYVGGLIQSPIDRSIFEFPPEEQEDKSG